jgi:hypothetical protein
MEAYHVREQDLLDSSYQLSFILNNIVLSCGIVLKEGCCTTKFDIVVEK